VKSILLFVHYLYLALQTKRCQKGWECFRHPLKTLSLSTRFICLENREAQLQETYQISYTEKFPIEIRTLASLILKRRQCPGSTGLTSAGWCGNAACISPIHKILSCCCVGSPLKIADSSGHREREREKEIAGNKKATWTRWITSPWTVTWSWWELRHFQYAKIKVVSLPGKW
jgi:hypothetical protein